MNDRRLGYIVLIVLLFFALLCAGFFVRSLVAPKQRRVVAFDNIGTIKTQDPVRIRGVTTGSIEKIQWHAGRVYVTIATSPLEIREGYAVCAVDVGVMGDRVIALDCGLPDGAAVPPGDTLEGTFVMGPSEAIGLAYKLREVIKSFERISAELLEGTETRKSLVEQYGDLAWFVDSLCDEVLGLSRTMDRELSGMIDDLQRFVDRTAAVTAEATRKLPAAVDTLDRMIERVDAGLGGIEDLIARVAPLLDKIEGPEVRAWHKRLMQIHEQIRDLRQVLRDLRRHGVNLKLLPL
jgi:ABC-type transporter Mla subunit MlaD